MSGRARVVALVAVSALIVLATGGYLVYSGTHDDPGSGRPAPVEVPVASLADQPRIVFRNTATGAAYGHVAVVSLADPGGPRGVTSRTCDRVDAVGDTTLCLRAHTGMTSAYAETATRADRDVLSLDQPGIPSRARLSPDGTLAATTGFVAGDSYRDAGFSTRTSIGRLDTGRMLHLETFRLTHQGDRITPVERNYWGVTFVDDDTFYVTVSFGGHTWLARGSVRDRSVETIHRSAECPSVSPDHTRVAYKKRQGSGGWRIAVLELSSGQETLLPEQRSVDDQVEWLDDDTVLYGLPLTGSRGGESDVWAMAANGSSKPRLLIPQASSPSVVR